MNYMSLKEIDEIQKLFELPNLRGLNVKTVHIKLANLTKLTKRPSNWRCKYHLIPGVRSALATILISLGLKINSSLLAKEHSRAFDTWNWW